MVSVVIHLVEKLLTDTERESNLALSGQREVDEMFSWIAFLVT